MKSDVNQFLELHIDIFEKILYLFWGLSTVDTKEKSVYCEQNQLFIHYPVDHEKTIDLEIKVDMDETRSINRIGLLYKLKSSAFSKVERYLALSFLYCCPYDLELCNQYGLYTKEDAKKMDQMKKCEKLYQYKKNKNLLHDNQFYIFNMNRIEDHCSDEALNRILQDFHTIVMEWNGLMK